MRKYLWIGLIAAALAGCSTTPSTEAPVDDKSAAGTAGAGGAQTGGAAGGGVTGSATGSGASGKIGRAHV